MSHIFISYSHTDKDYVHKLQAALQHEGLDVWIDDRIDYGTTWPKVIQQHLDDCSAFIVVMTEDAYESVWVQNEVTRAQRKKKPFFALLLKGEPWLAVEAIQYEDVTGNKLPSKKFYDSLALIIPRQEKAEPKKLLERPFQAQYKLLTRKSFPAWLGILGIIFIVIVGVIVAINPPPPPPVTATATFAALPTSTATFTPEPTITPIPTLGIRSSMISPKDGMKLMYVPAGNFPMGSTDADPLASGNEKPQHTVYLDAFWIDQTEVTNKMYAECVSANQCNPPSFASSATHPNYYGNYEFDNYPVINLLWNDATAYCKWAGRRLPTEAQWEKAARGTDGRIYPWGNDLPNNTLLNYNSNVGDTTAVGSYAKGASPYGALDMAGNVWQWLNDWYQYGYYATLGNHVSNPQGPSSSDLDGRVLRGGSLYSQGDVIRSANREGFLPTITYDAIGFRCASSTTP